MVETRRSRSRTPDPGANGPQGTVPGSPPGTSQMAEGSSPAASPPKKRGRPRKNSDSEQSCSPPRKRSDILLPILTQDAHGLWAQRFPGASREYTRLRAKKDLSMADMDSWIAKHSKAFGLYNNLITANIPSEGEDEGAEIVAIHAPEGEFMEGPGQNAPVSAAAGSSTSGMDQHPIDQQPIRVQPNFAVLQHDVSRVITDNLVSSVNSTPGTSQWLGKVHGLQSSGQSKAVSIKLPEGSVVSPSDPVDQVGATGQSDTDCFDQKGISLLDLGLTEHLSEDLINTIQSGKFVELHKLLPIDNADFDDEGKVLTFDEGESSMIVKSKETRKKITSFSQWSRAWSIYHAVYIDKFPHISKNLIKYAENMRTIAYAYSKNNDGWIMYDRHFRARMAKDKGNVYRWEKMDYELLHSKVLIPAIKKQLGGASTSAQSKQSVAGASKQVKSKDGQKPQQGRKFTASPSSKPCKFYNSDGGCSYKKACTFSHVCDICRKKGHNSLSCTRGTGKVDKSDK